MNNVISKIQNFGKFGYVIAKIAMILCGIGTVLALTASVVCLVIPKDFLEVKMQDQGTFIMNASRVLGEVSKEETEQLAAIMMDVNHPGGMKLNEKSYQISDVEFTDGSMEMKSDSIESGFNLRDVGFIFLAEVLTTATAFATMFFICSLCKELKNSSTPFSDVIIKKLNAIAISLIPLAVVNCFGNSFIRGILAGGTSLSLNANLGVLIMILLVFGLVQIFKYGAMLQRESDETL